MNLTLPSIDSKTGEALADSARQLKADARRLGTEAGEKVAESAKMAKAFVNHQLEEGQRQLKQGLTTTEKMLKTRRAQTAAWVRANPFTAIGTALAVGLILSTVSRGAR